MSRGPGGRSFLYKSKHFYPQASSPQHPLLSSSFFEALPHPPCINNGRRFQNHPAPGCHSDEWVPFPGDWGTLNRTTADHSSCPRAEVMSVPEGTAQSAQQVHEHHQHNKASRLRGGGAGKVPIVLVDIISFSIRHPWWRVYSYIFNGFRKHIIDMAALHRIASSAWLVVSCASVSQNSKLFS